MATESSTPATTTCTRTLKVCCDNDIRRLAVTFPEQATAEKKFALIQATVRSGFELSDSTTESIVLQYLDDEGDRCTLQAPTVEDLFYLYPQGPIKLQMERRTVEEAVAMEEDCKPSDELQEENRETAHREAEIVRDSPQTGECNAAAAAEVEEAAAPSTSSSSCSSSMPSMSKPEQWPNFFGQSFMAGMLLPFAAESANQPESRAAANEAGLSQREALLPLAKQLLDHAECIPESRGVKGLMQQFVDGTDPGHFGDACADILQAWAKSPSKQQVNESFTACLGDMMKVLPALRSCCGKSESKKCDEPEKQQSPRHSKQHAADGVSSSSRSSSSCSSEGAAEWPGMGFFFGKGKGKGKCREGRRGCNGNFSSGDSSKGCGKGMAGLQWWWQKAQEKMTGAAEGSGRCSGRSATPEEPSCAIPKGTRVVIHGLSKALQHNGKTGEVKRFDAQRSRYDVAIEGGASLLALQPQNITQLQEIEIVGLTQRADLNGKHGHIVSYQADSGRYRVSVDLPTAGSTAIALSPANCILQAGTRVVLRNLSNPKFSGEMAEIVAIDREAGRYQVRCRNGEKIAVKFEKVTC